jgi:isoquinoline 1-oxidoreductase beta subunit
MGISGNSIKMEVPKNPTLKDAKDFKILGKSIKRQDVPLKVTGKAVFGIDAEVPNMVYASVERCPVFGGSLKSFDKTATLKIAGVEQVIEVERIFGVYKSTGVAVVAKNYWAALQGRKALKILGIIREKKRLIRKIIPILCMN